MRLLPLARAALISASTFSSAMLASRVSLAALGWPSGAGSSDAAMVLPVWRRQDGKSWPIWLAFWRSRPSRTSPAMLVYLGGAELTEREDFLLDE
jgi:hypothetical protein